MRVLRNLGKITEGSKDFGDFFEHFMLMKILAWRDYRSHTDSVTYWRSKSGFEADFLISERIATETKATRHATERDLRGLEALREDLPDIKPVLVCREDRPREPDGVLVCPWEMFLEDLWSGRFS